MRNGLIFRVLCMALLLVTTGCVTSPQCGSLATQIVDLTIAYDDNRQTQVRLYAPVANGRYPLVTFSHGAFAAPERYDALLRPLAASGFVVAAPMHVDSELLTQGGPMPDPAFTWSTRKTDAREMARRVAAFEAVLSHARIRDPAEGYLAAGHSYGAFVAQTLGGAAAVGDSPDPVAAVTAVIAFSPPGPLPGFIDDTSWKSLAVPQLLLTGTADVLPGFVDDWQLHAQAHYDATPSDQWLWVGDDVDHYFGNAFGRLDREAPDQSAAFAQAITVMQTFAHQFSPQRAKSCDDKLRPGRSGAGVLSVR